MAITNIRRCRNMFQAITYKCVPIRHIKRIVNRSQYIIVYEYVKVHIQPVHIGLTMYSRGSLPVLVTLLVPFVEKCQLTRITPLKYSRYDTK